MTTDESIKQCIPEIPNSWIIVIIMIGLVILRALNIDTYVTAGLGLLIGYITGQHIQQNKNSQ